MGPRFPRPTTSKVPMSTTDPLLVMLDINKRFQGVQALSAATLEIEPGEIMALVGENGAGKSTMIKVLTGAYRRDFGLDRLRRPARRLRISSARSAWGHQPHLSGNQPRSLPIGG